MMALELIMNLGEALSLAHKFSPDNYLYLPPSEDIDENTRCAILLPDTVHETPVFAEKHGLIEFLDLDSVQQVLNNSKQQDPDTTPQKLVQAIAYYKKHDAFITFDKVVMRLGLFGGTFDPPHLGHLILAEAARDQLKLDEVLWIVAGQSPLKLDRAISPVETRVAMVQAAISSNPHFAISRVDLDRPGPHYTVDSLALLAQEFPNAEFYFVMGEDSLHDLPRWRDPARLIGQTWLAVLQRPGTDVDLSDLELAVPGVSQRVRWVQAPQLEIASSNIQRRIKEGRSVRYMLPEAVTAIVEKEGLYKT